MQAVALTRRLPTWFAVLLLSLSAAAQTVFDPLIGVVTDPDGEPIAGATVRAFRAGGRGTCLLDLAYRDDFRPVGAARTDRLGRFALQLPAGLPCRIVVDHAPHALWLREDCLPGLDLDIRLQQPATVRGRVTHHDGSPAKATVRAWNLATHCEVLRGETDAEGNYHFDRVAPCRLDLEITPTDGPSPMWMTLDIQAGDTEECDVALREGVQLTGRVVDGATGAPIAGARIGEGWTLHRAVTTDDDGDYELRGAGSAGRGQIRCEANGYVAQVVNGELEGPKARIEFRMQPGTRVTGRIVDRKGDAVAGAYVQAFGYAFADYSYHDLIAARTDADGRFSLGGLTPNAPHVLVVRKDGYGARSYALPEPDGDTAALPDLTLGRARIVRGVLRGLDGKPLADTEVFLHGYNDDRHALAPDGVLAQGTRTQYDGWGLLDRYVGQRKVRSDHLGRFAFGDVAPGTYRVVARDEDRGEMTVDSAPFDVTERGAIEVIELAAPR